MQSSDLERYVCYNDLRRYPIHSCILGYVHFNQYIFMFAYTRLESVLLTYKRDPVDYYVNNKTQVKYNLLFQALFTYTKATKQN